MINVSVVIPSYNGVKLLQKNLPMVLLALRAGDELVIVDDASQDNSVTWLIDKFKFTKVLNNKVYSQVEHVYQAELDNIKFKLIVNQHNLRFGAVANLGVNFTSQSLILLLNNDVSPYPNVITQLSMHFNDKKVFAVGCLEIEPKLNLKGGKNKLWFEKGMFMHSRALNYKSGETAWASGGSAMFDKKKFQQLNGFDLAYYPAYWEDIDLSFRAKKISWKILFDEKAVVIHNHESTNVHEFGEQKINQISFNNAQIFVKRHANGWQKIEYLLWKPYWWWQKNRFKIV